MRRAIDLKHFSIGLPGLIANNAGFWVAQYNNRLSASDVLGSRGDKGSTCDVVQTFVIHSSFMVPVQDRWYVVFEHPRRFVVMYQICTKYKLVPQNLSRDEFMVATKRISGQGYKLDCDVPLQTWHRWVGLVIEAGGRLEERRVNVVVERGIKRAADQVCTAEMAAVLGREDKAHIK